MMSYCLMVALFDDLKLRMAKTTLSPWVNWETKVNWIIQNVLAKKERINKTLKDQHPLRHENDWLNSYLTWIFSQRVERQLSSRIAYRLCHTGWFQIFYSHLQLSFVEVLVISIRDLPNFKHKELILIHFEYKNFLQVGKAKTADFLYRVMLSYIGLSWVVSKYLCLPNMHLQVWTVFLLARASI